MKYCPKCHSTEYTKDGIVGDRQRYKCKSCLYRYTVEHRGFSSDIKRQALILYLQGLDFRSIGRILQCSHVSAHNWIKSYGKGIEDIRSLAGVEQVNMVQLSQQIATQKIPSETTLLLIDMKNKPSAFLCFTDQESIGSIDNIPENNFQE